MQPAGESHDSVPLRQARPGGRLLPVMQYRNLGGAIAWLTRAFGFAEYEIVRAEDGTPLYALMSFGNALIMLGPVRDDEVGGLIKQPDETGGAETQSCYFVVDDADAHCAAAKAAGADIILDIRPYDYGGRGYTCRDPEGHIWSFGTYDPWRGSAGPAGRRMSIPWLPALVAVLGTIAAAGWVTAALLMGGTEAPVPQPVAARPAPATTAALQAERAARERAESAFQEASKRAAVERESRQRIEQRLEEASKGAAGEGETRQRVEHALDQAQKHAAAERHARTRIEEVLAKVSSQAALEQKARQDAERAAAAARDASARQQDAKAKAEARLQKVRQQLEREQKTLKTLQADLRAAVAAKEKAERTAQGAMKRLAEIEARANAVPPLPQAAPRAAPAPSQEVSPNAQRNVTREVAEPMPALIP